MQQRLEAFAAVHERLLQYVTDVRFAPHAAAAHERFAVLYGKSYDDEPDYEARMAAFNEWFLLEYPLTAAGTTPALVVLADRSSDLDDTHRVALAAWCMSRLTLVRVEGQLSHVAVCNDVGGGHRYPIASELWQIAPPRGLYAIVRPLMYGPDTFVTTGQFLMTRETSRFVNTEYDALLRRYGHRLIELLMRLHQTEHRYGTLQVPQRLELAQRTLEGAAEDTATALKLARLQQPRRPHAA